MPKQVKPPRPEGSKAGGGTVANKPAGRGGKNGLPSEAADVASRAERPAAPQPEVPGADRQVREARQTAAHPEPKAQPVHPGVPLAPPGIAPESDVRVHSPAAAAPQPSHGQMNGEGLGQLPTGYGDGRLVGLVRDPVTLFVYWDFSPHQVEQAFFGLGPARAVLKLWNARSSGSELVRETEVHLEARGWYVRDLPPNTELRPEVWAIGERGARLLRAARPVRLPPALASDQLEAFYLRLPLNEPLPREGGSGAGHTLNYGGALPAGWDRRLQPRWVNSSLGGAPGSQPPGGPGALLGPGLPGSFQLSSSFGRLPWSGTHLLPDLEEEE